MGALSLVVLLGFLGSAAGSAQQTPFSSHAVPHENNWYQLPHKVEKVAVIGAGPSGLLHAATLLEAGFEVRMFERAPKPGGQWFYTEKIPVQAPFPCVSIHTLTRAPYLLRTPSSEIDPSRALPMFLTFPNIYPSREYMKTAKKVSQLIGEYENIGRLAQCGKAWLAPNLQYVDLP